MTSFLTTPSATSEPEALADYLELRALEADDKNASFNDLVRDLIRTGTLEAVSDESDDDEEEGDAPPRVDEAAEDIAQSVWAELEGRLAASGGEGGQYPFAVEEGHIQITADPHRSPYLFLLLLSNFGIGASPSGTRGDTLFEDISAEASASYFGGAKGLGGAAVFGFPRRVLPSSFAPAIDRLCELMGEGARAPFRAPERRQKDAKLDIVAWRNFPDGREGKLLGFGQCATGRYWRNKVTELDAQKFLRKWLSVQPAVTPIGMFFVPFRVPPGEWYNVAVDGGVLFDRCRIANHVSVLPSKIEDRCALWCEHVIKTKLCA